MEIEDEAYTFLHAYDKTLLTEPSFPPVAGFLEYLRKSYGVNVIVTDLGQRNGLVVVGKVVFSTNTICVSEDIIADQQAFASTVGHEIGHWVLHRHRPIRIEDRQLIEESDDNEITVLGPRRSNTKNRTTRDWMEHQAKVFSGALLMPVDAFRVAVVSAQKHLGVTRNLGRVRRDYQGSSERDLQSLIAILQQVYGLSKEAIRVRLLGTGIIQSSTKIGNILGDMLDRRFS
jgi:Zn-dependent peptidase ImmA (M78 family)